MFGSGWSENGELRDAGVLLHLLDGYETNDMPWLPREGLDDVSASLIFHSMRNRDGSNGIPLFGGTVGLVFGPVTTVIRCGNAADAGGHCSDSMCRYAPAQEDEPFPGDGCQHRSWFPKDVGYFLEKVNAYQQLYDRSFYNELIVNAHAWDADMRAKSPTTIEAIFVLSRDVTAINIGRDLVQRMSEMYGFSSSQRPLLYFDEYNWDHPFSVL